MRMYDIIFKKREGKALTDQELAYLVRGAADGSIPDYQLSAFLMAVYFRGLDARETAVLTDQMARSGGMADLSSIPGVKADKHSTGGVGDKTSLVVCPIVASCGVAVAKMSGRGLGHTGGTIDKLESIPGFRTELDAESFLRQVRGIGLAIAGQSGNLVPADKKLYALRDVTATVDNISLIAASIMSKKIAAGADAIVLDVKTGSGAFMKTAEEAMELARVMVDIGTRVGRRAAALITDMSRPLGFAVGNALEVAEAVRTLSGEGPKDLTAVCVELAAMMLSLAGRGELNSCRELAREALRSGLARQKLRQMVEAQGGDPAYIDDPGLWAPAPVHRDLLSPKDGYIAAVDAAAIGRASVLLGAGRLVKDGPIDHAAGIRLGCAPGDRIRKGETLATLYCGGGSPLDEAARVALDAFAVEEKPVLVPPLFYARVQAHRTVRLDNSGL